jgi:hypothetical protein
LVIKEASQLLLQDGLARLLESESEVPSLRCKATDAAWFEGYDIPVLLRIFSEIKSRQTAEAERILRA